MPYLLIRTNTDITSDNQKAMLQKASAVTAEALGKPERYVMVSIEANVPMVFAGEESPCAYLELKSIGLPGEQTSALSSTLCRLISESLNIPADRVYIEFADAERHMWGWNNSTF